MAVSRTLRRLHRVLENEEEQVRTALEAALGELKRLEHAREAAAARERNGRRLVAASARTGELRDRVAGMEEVRTAGRYAAALAGKIAEQEAKAAALRQRFLEKRIECRQAETLMREAEARDAAEAGRRGQRGLDDWYLNRMQPPGRKTRSTVHGDAQQKAEPEKT